MPPGENYRIPGEVEEWFQFFFTAKKKSEIFREDVLCKPLPEFNIEVDYLFQNIYETYVGVKLQIPFLHNAKHKMSFLSDILRYVIVIIEPPQ